MNFSKRVTVVKTFFIQKLLYIVYINPFRGFELFEFYKFEMKI